MKNIPLIILGACNKVMGMFIPIAVSLLWVNGTGIDGWKAIILISVGTASTLFRGIQVWLE